MGKTLRGLLTNRINEGHNFNKDKLIHEGDDITMYYYTDRTCYFVKKVIDQKHIIVRPYHVCADHSKEPGMGHQDWLYFKTLKEHNEYLNSCHLFYKGKELHYEVDNIKESPDQEWVYRYGAWRRKYVCPDTDEVSYSKLEPVSFGVREYYYDWSY